MISQSIQMGPASRMTEIPEDREMILRFPERMVEEKGARRGIRYEHVKTGIEWGAALCLALVAAPLVLTLAAAVKLSSHGPAFYSQTRLGRGGSPTRYLNCARW